MKTEHKSQGEESNKTVNVNNKISQEAEKKKVTGKEKSSKTTNAEANSGKDVTIKKSDVKQCERNSKENVTYDSDPVTNKDIVAQIIDSLVKEVVRSSICNKTGDNSLQGLNSVPETKDCASNCEKKECVSEIVDNQKLLMSSLSPDSLKHKETDCDNSLSTEPLCSESVNTSTAEREKPVDCEESDGIK